MFFQVTSSKASHNLSPAASPQELVCCCPGPGFILSSEIIAPLLVLTRFIISLYPCASYTSVNSSRLRGTAQLPFCGMAETSRRRCSRPFGYLRGSFCFLYPPALSLTSGALLSHNSEEVHNSYLASFTICPSLLVTSWFLWLRHRDELSFPFSVNDKSKILSPVAVPDYIPELTVGGLDADSIFHSYREVRGHSLGKRSVRPFRVDTESRVALGQEDLWPAGRLAGSGETGRRSL